MSEIFWFGTLGCEIFWLGAFGVLLLIEILTLGLTTIWFAVGALAAFLLALVQVPLMIQIVVFIVVSVVMLVFTRPFVVKYINSHHEKTNYEGIIGKVVRITEKVDNLQQTGTAVVNGLEWTTRAERDDVILDPGDLAKVVNISGVKLIVKKYEEE